MPPKNDHGPGNTVATPQVVLIPEVLREILLFATHPTLHSCIQVNSTFYEVAGPLLYREVRINRNGFSSFSHAPGGPASKPRRDAVSRYTRTSQLELLKHIEVLEIARHDYCWHARYRRRQAVLTAFSAAKTVRLHFTHISHSEEHQFCGKFLDVADALMAASKTCCLLARVKPANLVIYPYVESASRWADPTTSLSQLLVANFAMVKRIVLVLEVTKRHQTDGVSTGDIVRRWVPRGWSEALEVHFACYDLSAPGCHTPNEHSYMPVRALAASIASCLDHAPCALDIVYSSDRGPKSKYRGENARVSSGAQVKNYMRKRYVRFFPPTSGQSLGKLGRIMTKTEYIASGRKHELPEDIIMEWAEQQGRRKGKRAASQVDNQPGWTRGGEIKRQRV